MLWALLNLPLIKFFFNVNRLTGLQNIKILLAICEKTGNYASTGNYIRPCLITVYSCSKSKHSWHTTFTAATPVV